MPYITTSHYQKQAQNHKHAASHHRGRANRHQRSAARNTHRAEYARQNVKQHLNLQDNDEPSSWIGKAIISVASVIALPITFGMRLATEHPFIAASVALGASIIGAMSAPIIASERSKRMIGDVNHSHNEESMLFAATIYRNGKQICSGTIIDHKTVLTAAHCIYKRNMTEFEVGIGSPYFIFQQKVSVSSAIPHPDYVRPSLAFKPLEAHEYDNSTDYDYSTDYDSIEDKDYLTSVLGEFENLENKDIALIKVIGNEFKTTGLKFTALPKNKNINNLKTICTDKNKKEKISFWMIGSGANGDEGDIKKVTQTMKSGYLKFSDKCITDDGLSLNIQYDPSTKENSMWCVGDSGAGVFHVKDTKEGKKAQLVAVTSNSNAIAGTCLPHEKLRSLFPLLEGRATLLNNNMLSFIKKNMDAQHGLERWDEKIPDTIEIKPQRKVKEPVLSFV